MSLAKRKAVLQGTVETQAKQNLADSDSLFQSACQS